MTEKTYSVIEEGQKIVKKLCERYPDVLWQVNPELVVVLGCDNKEPTKRSKSFVVRSVKNAEKAVFLMNKVRTRFIIETFWGYWNNWSTPRKEWVILNALLRVSKDEGKLIKPDSVDFSIILDQVSFGWDSDGANLPSLTAGDPVKFDLDLRPGLSEEELEDGEED
jgi:hypothetical protein